MNYLQLSSRYVLSVKLYFPVFNFSHKHNASSLLIKASDSSVPTNKSKATAFPQNQNDRALVTSSAVERKLVRKSGKKEHHLWQRRDQAGSGHKAMNLVRTICGLPNEKEAVYSALDEWIAWETEFPLIAAAKALVILRKRSQWKRIIQVAKWMLSKGQGATMATYDHLLLAFDMDKRPEEAKMLWNMILHVHNRSISKRLFSRMVSLYDHHNMPSDVIETFADMEELGVKPDEDTVRRIARAFEVLGQEDKQKQFLAQYQRRWKYIHFKGERVRMGSSSDDEPDLRVSNKSRSQRRATFLESDPDDEMGKTSNEKPDFNDPEIDTFQMKSYHLFKTSTSKSRSRMRATFLENDLDDEDHEPLPQQQAPLCVSKPERSELYCWPWACIVSNIQDESMSGGSAAADRYCYWLKKFSKYKPIRFKMFWNKHLQTAQAVLGFDGHSFGFKNAMKFEKSFEAKGQSKNEWYERRTCPGPNPYGWFAREDDYNSRGPVGDYLRRKRQLKTIADLVLESTNDRNALLSEINLKNGNIQLLSACRMFEVKNELRHSTKEEYRKLLSEYRKLQLLARKHSMRVLDEQEMLNIELEEKKKCLDFSAEELKNRETLEGQKLKEEKEKREKEEAVEKVLKLEGEKKKLNTEIEKLKGKMEVMKHMIGDDYTAVQQKINQMDELLQDKNGELEDLEDLNQHLLVKERQSNDKLQEARKALISGLCDMLSDSDSRVSIGIKGMGDIEVEPFKNACMKRYSPEEADIKAVHLCSLWQEKLKNPQWHPFRVVEEQLEVMEDDEMLVQLREEWGDKAYEAVATALKEIQEYNPSGCYVVLELWNFKEKRKASLEEVISHIFKELKTLKRKRT